MTETKQFIVVLEVQDVLIDGALNELLHTALRDLGDAGETARHHLTEVVTGVQVFGAINQE